LFVCCKQLRYGRLLVVKTTRR